jgi:uncharacterized repeat protein (TIGR01451 family)
MNPSCNFNFRLTVLLTLLAAAFFEPPASAAPLSAASRTRLVRGQPTWVIVEFDVAEADRQAVAERVGRRLERDDSAILALRTQAYRRVKTAVVGTVSAPDGVEALDYDHFALAVWRLSSVEALNRLQSQPFVRAVHENTALRPLSVSDLGFIDQPQAAAQGDIGSGTTIAVIDGGLGDNYLNFPDFGTCSGVNTPVSTCRVAYNRDFFPGASAEIIHGTNVSTIALGVAPGAKLAMFNVFNGGSASTADVLSAMNSAISLKATYNIVAINMSLGDSSSNTTQCTGSAFRSAATSASNAGILVVVAAGNSGSKSGLADPACVPGVVSVGAVYDAAYGSVSWLAPSAPGGQCTDSSAADKVACFSQSASYLSVLAPGSFVDAPNSSFRETGTSQATPHVSGAVAVLRARYPAEPLSSTVRRLTISGVSATDSTNGHITPRLDLLAAVNQGTALVLSGSGPANATSGTTSQYVITATNNGPLLATDVGVVTVLPPGATFESASAGCTFASGSVTCSLASLSISSQATFNIRVRWAVNGPVYSSTSVMADQLNNAPAGQQTLAFGIPPSADADAPLPQWAYALLGAGLLLLSNSRYRAGQMTSGKANRQR